MKDMKNTSNTEVPSVELAIRILDFLSRYKNKRSTLTEIQKKLDINKSTCLRILRTLKKHGYVHYYESTKQYSLGVSLVVLGTRAAEFSDVLEIVKPYLHSLMEQTQLTTVLVQKRIDNHLMYVAKEEPENAIHVHVNVGQYFPVSPSSFGKCFMAYMDEDERKRAVEEMIKKKRFTPKTITDMKKLEEELRNVTINGYALSQEELTIGVTGIASPIFNEYKKVSMVALCLGVSTQIMEDMIPIYGEKVRNMAIMVTKELGGRLPDNYLR